MAKHKDIGLSYSRFSDPKQSTGDSEDRQNRDYLAFCDRHKLIPASQAFIDRGLSGYTGKHAQKGDLARLIDLARATAWPTGTVVVVEAWDRLGRQRPDRQMALISDLLRTGLKIGVCRLDDIFSEEDFGTHKFTTLSVFVQLAYQESKQRSERVGSYWKKLRRDAREKGVLLTRRLPAWLRLMDGHLQPIPDRVATIRRIFQMAREGYGISRITTTLNRDGTPAFGEHKINPGRKRSQFSGRWAMASVGRILTDRRVLGEMQPRTTDEKPDGPPILDYFPRVIEQADFDLAQTAAAGRKTYDGRPLRQRVHGNVFAGLLRHAPDGLGFLLANKGTVASPELHLLSAAGVEVGTRRITFPYPVFERVVLSLLAEVKPADVLPAQAQPGSLEVLRARHDVLLADIEALSKDLDQGYSAAISKLVRKKEAELGEVKEQLERERAAAAHPLEQSWDEAHSLMKLLDEAADPDDMRLRMRAALRRVLDSIWILVVKRGLDRLVAIQIYFTGTALHRDYLVYHRQARHHPSGRTPAICKVGDVAELDLPAVDLRRTEEAQQLAQALSEHETAAAIIRELTKE